MTSAIRNKVYSITRLGGVVTADEDTYMKVSGNTTITYVVKFIAIPDTRVYVINSNIVIFNKKASIKEIVKVLLLEHKLEVLELSEKIITKQEDFLTILKELTETRERNE